MKRKSIIVLSIGILLIISALLGLSYAYWRLTYTQENQNVVLSDCFEVTFQGENDIYLPKAYPMDDEEFNAFLSTAVPYHFTITNKCSSKASAVINLEVLETEGVKRLPDSAIDVLLYNGTMDINTIIREEYANAIYNNNYKELIYGTPTKALRYNLTNYSVNQEKVIKEAVSAYKMYNFVLAGNSSREFHLLLSMNKDTPPTSEMMQATFNSKVTVSTSYNGTYGMIQESCWVRTGDINGDLCTDTAIGYSEYGIKATKLIIQNELLPIDGAIASFDESIDKDQSVMSYVVENEDSPSTYTIYLQGNGQIVLPPDSSYLFEGPGYITEIEGLNYLDTSNVTNMANMFNSLWNLSSIDVSSFDTSNVTNMSAMLSGVGAETLDVSNFNTSNVTNMSNMFSGMINLTSLDVRNFNTSKVTNMSGMFSTLRALTNLDISSFNTSNVTDMSRMFYNTNSLTNLDLRHFNTGKVTNMTMMFERMHAITSLNVSSFDTSNVTNMASMFYNAYGLTSLNVSSFDTSNVTNMYRMFASNGNLTSLDLKNFNTSNVLNMSSMFYNIPSLTNLNVSSFDTSNVRSMSSMFSNLSSLTNLDVSNFNTRNVEEMTYMFASMSSLTSLDLSNFNTSNVGSMYEMFAEDSKLTNITYGNDFVYNNTSVYGMFKNCPANKPIHPSWDGVVYDYY